MSDDSDPGRLQANAPTRFARSESGALVIFSLFLFAAMMLMTGLAVDVLRSEVARTKLQNTLDRAVLAAADLDQTLPPQDVVLDYFEKAGLVEHLGEVDVDDGLNYRTVAAETSVNLPTLFLKQVGITELVTPAVGTANETITDVEISLVLDNSGSMGSANRLDLLKEAADEFIDIVTSRDAGEGKVSISIVPFATQVSAGPELLEYFNVSEEHDYSHCVNFSDSDFTTPSVSTTAPLQRTGHFDVGTWNSPPHPSYLTCPTSSNRHITVMSGEADDLKDRIDDMWAAGNTSIDIGVKWGLALLDPSTRPIITDLIAEGKVSDSFAGRPVDHDETQVLKALVVMSDGENTSQFMLDDDYRSGDSPLFRDKNNGRESYYFNRSNTNNDYYYYRNDEWRSTPYRNWDRAERLSWPEVWASRSVANFAYYSKRAAIGGNWYSYYLDAYDAVSPSTKNTRTSQICQQAKDAGITVYTIGMETYGQGDITLADCASGSAFFFDVQAVEISQAFSAIARDINRLRLTQ